MANPLINSGDAVLVVYFGWCDLGIAGAACEPCFYKMKMAMPR